MTDLFPSLFQLQPNKRYFFVSVATAVRIGRVPFRFRGKDTAEEKKHKLIADRLPRLSAVATVVRMKGTPISAKRRFIVTLNNNRMKDGKVP